MLLDLEMRRARTARGSRSRPAEGCRGRRSASRGSRRPSRRAGRAATSSRAAAAHRLGRGEALAALAHEELHAERALELGDRGGDRGLRDVQVERRLRHRPLLRGRDEVAQLGERQLRPDPANHGATVPLAGVLYRIFRCAASALRALQMRRGLNDRSRPTRGRPAAGRRVRRRRSNGRHSARGGRGRRRRRLPGRARDERALRSRGVPHLVLSAAGSPSAGAPSAGTPRRERRPGTTASPMEFDGVHPTGSRARTSGRLLLPPSPSASRPPSAPGSR